MMDEAKLKEEILAEIMAAMDERVAQKIAQKKGAPMAPSVEIEIESEGKPGAMGMSEKEDEESAMAMTGGESVEDAEEEDGSQYLPERLRSLMKNKIAKG